MQTDSQHTADSIMLLIFNSIVFLFTSVQWVFFESQIESILKIIVLISSATYTIWRFRTEYVKEQKNDKNQPKF
jgi:hypothetical protein